MKTIFRILMLGLLVLSSYRTSAQFVYLTDNRSAAVSGSTNGVVVYAVTNTPPIQFGPFNASLFERNLANDYVDGTAAQVSLLTSNSIIVTNRIAANYDYRAAPPSDTGTAAAKDTCEITFSVQTPTICSLTGSESVNSLISIPLASLTSSNHGIITTAPMSGLPWVYQGVLQPDTYVLKADMGFQYIAQGGRYDGGDAEMFVILNALPPPQVTAVNLNNNMLQLSVSTAAGSTNRVLVSTDLTVPISQWQPIATNVADGSGVFQFTNSIAPGQDREFFRISVP